MKKDEIKDAFGRIQAGDEIKERIYWAAQRDASDKEYRSKKRMHYFRMRVDQMIPLAACFVLLIFAFSYLAVTNGWFTGAKPQEFGAASSDTARMAEGGTAEALEETPEKATAPEDAPSENAMKDELAQAQTAGIADARDITAYGAIDVGFTAFQITGVPAEPLSLWEELVRIGAVPGSIALKDAALADGKLTLDFSPQMQTIMDASATTSVITGIALSYKALFPELTELEILSDGNALTFGGEAIDAAALMNEHVSVTDTKILAYKGDFQ